MESGSNQNVQDSLFVLYATTAIYKQSSSNNQRADQNGSIVLIAARAWTGEDRTVTEIAEYGYIRVSTAEQNLDRQIVAMHEAGVPERNIYADKQSGKDFDRPEYIKLVRKLRKGDTLYIHSIDRLGRNYEAILDEWRLLTKEGIGIVVLDMPILNTSKDRDLTGKLISDIVLQLLSYVAQTEREFILQRQAEGIAAAKARGVHFGRKAMQRPDGIESVLDDYLSGRLSARKAAQISGVAHTTIMRWARQEVRDG